MTAARHIEAAASQMGVDYGEALGRILSMPQSSKEKQEAFRARNEMLGLTEVRGIFLPPSQHEALKKLAREFPQPNDSPLREDVQNANSMRKKPPRKGA